MSVHTWFLEKNVNEYFGNFLLEIFVQGRAGAKSHKLAINRSHPGWLVYSLLLLVLDILRLLFSNMRQLKVLRIVSN
jgi:hypothetical protein